MDKLIAIGLGVSVVWYGLGRLALHKYGDPGRQYSDLELVAHIGLWPLVVAIGERKRRKKAK